MLKPEIMTFGLAVLGREGNISSLRRVDIVAGSLALKLAAAEGVPFGFAVVKGMVEIWVEVVFGCELGQYGA